MLRRALTVLVAAVLLAGCTASIEPDGDPTPSASPDLEAVSREAVEALAAGDSAPLHTLFSPSMAAQLSAQQLEAAWAQTIATAGEYTGTESVSVAEKEGFTVVTVTSGFTTRPVLADLTYGHAGQLEGLWFSYGEAPTTAPAEPPDLPEGATEEEIAVGQYELPGKLLLPGGAGPNAAVLLVGGSGPTDMDGTVGTAGNAVLRDLAYQLAEHGVPTLRYDKRFAAHPELATSASTIQDEVLDDVAAAIELMGAMPELESREIVVLGHSLGGMLLPEIVADSPEVAGGVIVAGTARSLWAVIGSQNEQAIDAALEAETITEEQAAEQRTALAAEIARAETLTDPHAESILGVLSAAYVVSVNELKLPELAAGLEIPLLVLQGANDFQVSAGADFESWRPVLEANADVTYELFPGLNHLMMPADSDVPDVSQYDIPANVAPEVTALIADWLTARW